MADKRKDPYRNFRFRVEIDGIYKGSFSEVTIPDSTTDVTEYREGNDPLYQRKLSGLIKYGNITMKKGITDSKELYEWRQRVEEKGAINERKGISLILIDEEGNDKSHWDVVNAWPTKYSAGGLSAKANEVLIETIEIVHEGIIRKK
jgi:phage tail-like protein